MVVVSDVQCTVTMGTLPLGWLHIETDRHGLQDLWLLLWYPNVLMYHVRSGRNG